MYVIRTRPGFEGSDGYQHPPQSTLTELSAADLRAATSDTPPDWAKGFTFKRVYAERAHAWVQSGRIHETALYTDIDGRIRYARDGY